MTRDELLFIVAARATGSPPPQPHTHIECFCRGHVHRRDEYDVGCFCPPCASKASVALGYPPTDIESEEPDADDSPQWCQECGVLISEKITADGAEDELVEYEHRPRVAPDDWRAFLLCVRFAPNELLPRIEAVIRRATPDVMAIEAAKMKRMRRELARLAQLERATKGGAR